MRFLIDLGLVNFSVKFDTKLVFILKTDMTKLFELNAKKANQPADVDSEVIFYSAPYIQYEETKLNDNYRADLQTTMTSEHALKSGTKKTPYQKSYELNIGVKLFTVDFRGANKQFSFLEISIVYDCKNNQHNLICDSYNVELTSTKIKPIKLENASNMYNSFNKIKFDT